MCGYRYLSFFCVLQANISVPQFPPWENSISNHPSGLHAELKNIAYHIFLLSSNLCKALICFVACKWNFLHIWTTWCTSGILLVIFFLHVPCVCDVHEFIFVCVSVCIHIWVSTYGSPPRLILASSSNSLPLYSMSRVSQSNPAHTYG